MRNVRSDIEELEAQLKAKIAEESSLINELAAVDKSIGVIRQKYERQLQRIQDGLRKVEREQDECKKGRKDFGRRTAIASRNDQ